MTRQQLWMQGIFVLRGEIVRAGFEKPERDYAGIRTWRKSKIFRCGKHVL